MTLRILPIQNQLMTIMEGINKAIGSDTVFGLPPNKPSKKPNPKTQNPLQLNLKPKTSSTQRPQTQKPKTQHVPSPKQ